MHFLAIVLLAVLALANSAAAESPPLRGWRAWSKVPDVAPTTLDTLSLHGALSRVKLANPTLRGLAYRIDGASARIGQAGAYPNPSFVFDAENVGGGYSGFDESELSFVIGQEIEMGGKRSKRVEVATREANEITLDAESAAFDLFLETKARYADVVHAEERLRLGTEADSVVSELVRSAEERVRAGAALVADAAIAAAARARTLTAIDDAVANRTQTRVALSTLWGDTFGFDESIDPALTRTPDPLSPDSALSWAASGPHVQRFRLANATLRAEANLERGLRVPNLSLGGGGRRVEADGVSTFLFGVGLPLPLWDRRGDAIRAADAQVRASSFAVERVQAEIAGLIVAHISALTRARARLSQMESELIPTLESALESMRMAYAIGRTSYADLLEVQRTLIEIRNDANDTRRAITVEQIEIERLAGRTIEELMTND